MALPLDNRQVTNVITTSWDARRPRLVDQFFNSNGLFTRLHTKDNIKHEGGDKIRVGYIYGGLGGGSYGKGDTFDTAQKEFMTEMFFDWKRNYAPVALDNLDQAKNQGAARLINLTETLWNTAKLTLADNCGKQIFGDGTGNGGKDMDGLLNAIATTGTYGGITRSLTDPVGSAILGQVNSTGGPLSLPMINTSYGSATISDEKPDLGITTQTIWNKLWERSQPSERNQAEDLRKIGFDNVRINSMDVIVDSHCPSGYFFGLNTKFIEFWIMEGHDFRLRGPYDVHNEDSWVGQVILYSNLICTSPRLNFVISNIS